MKLILRLLLDAGAIFLIANYTSLAQVDTFTTSIIVAIVLGLVNTFIRPIIKLLTLPLTIITLGLFSLVVNAFLVWIVTLIVPGFAIAGFLNYILFAIVLSLLTGIIGWFVD